MVAMMLMILIPLLMITTMMIIVLLLCMILLVLFILLLLFKMNKRLYDTTVLISLIPLKKKNVCTPLFQYIPFLEDNNKNKQTNKKYVSEIGSIKRKKDDIIGKKKTKNTAMIVLTFFTLPWLLE